MKAKPGKAAPLKRRPGRAPRRGGGTWQMSDLPAELQAELRHRLEEAKRGENLIPFDEALEEAERMASEIAAILNRPLPRRPSE